MKASDLNPTCHAITNPDPHPGRKIISDPSGTRSEILKRDVFFTHSSEGNLSFLTINLALD